MWLLSPRRGSTEMRGDRYAAEYRRRRMEGRHKGRHQGLTYASKSEALLFACRVNDPLVWLVPVKGSRKRYRLVFGGVLPPRRATHRITNRRRSDGKGRYYRVRTNGALHARKDIHELHSGRNTNLECSDYQYDYAYRSKAERHRDMILRGVKRKK